MAASDNSAPGTVISNGNCRTDGGQSSAVNLAQVKITNSSIENGSETAGFVSVASPASTLPKDFFSRHAAGSEKDRYGNDRQQDDDIRPSQPANLLVNAGTDLKRKFDDLAENQCEYDRRPRLAVTLPRRLEAIKADNADNRQN